MADDLNSSDYEQMLGEETPTIIQLSTTAGQAFRKAIHENQVTDRLYSKKVLRELQNSRGAPGTRDARAMAHNVMDQFLTDRGHDGDMIERFIVSLIQHTQPSIRGKGIPSVSTIRSKWFYAIDDLTFRYPDLPQQYTRHNVKRIQTIIDNHVRSGKLYHGFYLPREWLGFVMIQKLVHAYLHHALQQGCRSWDAIINRVLGVVLQSACDSRPGDVALSGGYGGQEYLQWKHIELTLRPGGTSVQHLAAKVTLKFEKGHKDAHNIDKVVFLEPLVEDMHSAVCAIKLLVTHALRWGVVHARTLEGLLAHTARRCDRTVQWVRPTDPVLLGVHSLLERPVAATPRLALSTVRTMGLLAGVVKPIDNRAIRRGAARDTAYSQAAGILGVARQGTAAVLGHNRKALAAGVTDNYVGPLQQCNYLAKANASFADALAPMINQQLAPPSTRSTKWQVDEYMHARGLDVADGRQRIVARGQLRNDRVDQWRAQASNAMVTLDPSPAPPTGHAMTDAPATTAAEFPIDPCLLDIDDPDPAIHVDEASLGRLQELVLAPGTSQASRSSRDPSAAAAAADDDDDAGVAGGVAALKDQQRWVNHASTLPGDRFVRLFCAINVYRRMSHAPLEDFAGKPMFRPVTGNSREAPTPFLFECGKGCGYGKPLKSQTDLHEVWCDGVSKDPQTPTVPCREPSCDRQFATELRMRKHFDARHAWHPRPCYQCSDPTTLFPTLANLLTHVYEVHDLLNPERPCPLQQECRGTTMFKRAVLLRVHLRAVHHKTKTEVYALLAPPPSAPRLPVVCPLDGCDAPSPFSTFARLRAHLYTAHQLPDEQILMMVPLTSYEMGKRRKRARDADQELQTSLLGVCGLDGCPSTTLLAAPTPYLEHLMAGFHRMSREEANDVVEERLGVRAEAKPGSWLTTKCPRDDFAWQHLDFRSGTALLTHLTSKRHGMTDQEARALILQCFGRTMAQRPHQTVAKPPVQSHACPLGCESPAEFTRPGLLAVHLQRKYHGLSVDEARATSERLFGRPIQQCRPTMPSV